MGGASAAEPGVNVPTAGASGFIVANMERSVGPSDEPDRLANGEGAGGFAECSAGDEDSFAAR